MDSKELEKNEEEVSEELIKTDTPAFQQWFKGSRIVDSEQRPLKMYRGTRGGLKGYLNTMSFTSSPDIASVYSAHPGHSVIDNPHWTGSVYPVHLSIKNPVELHDPQMTFGDLLREFGYGKSGGIDHEEATKILNHMANRLSGKVKLPPFQYKILDEYGREDESYEPGLDFGALNRTSLHNFRDQFQHSLNPRDALDLADNLHSDTYAFVDTPGFVRAATARGHDGVIHGDVFDTSAPAHLLNKPTHRLEGVNIHYDLEGRQVPVHLTYRPFSQSQIKSLYNQGTYDPNEQDITKSEAVVVSEENLDKSDTQPVAAPEHEDWLLRSLGLTPTPQPLGKGDSFTPKFASGDRILYHGTREGFDPKNIQPSYLTPSRAIAEMYSSKGALHSFSVHPEARWYDMARGEEMPDGSYIGMLPHMDSWLEHPSSEEYQKKLGRYYDVVWDSDDFRAGNHQVFVLNPKVLIHRGSEMFKTEELIKTDTPAFRQWKDENLSKGSLQSRMPYNPKRDASINSIVTAAEAQQEEGRASYARENMPRMKGNERARALHKLSGKTTTRLAADGKREFLLHRGDRAHSFDETRPVDHSYYTGWTPDHREARHFGGVTSAWVHEDKIHSIPRQLGHVEGLEELESRTRRGKPLARPEPGPNQYRSEWEVVVVPGHNSKYHEPPVPTQQEQDAYKRQLRIEHYKSLRQKSGLVTKSEPLDKMALAGQKSGVPHQEPLLPRAQDDSDWVHHDYDYSHLLPKGLEGNYRVVLREKTPAPRSFHMQSPTFAVSVLHLPTGNNVGGVLGTYRTSSRKEDHSVVIGESAIKEEHQNQGLGRAAYEAAMTHGLHKYKIHTSSGRMHSDDARRLHTSLYRRHGTEEAKYDPARLDDRFDHPFPNSGYRYTYKSEPLDKMAIANLQPATGQGKPTYFGWNEHDYSHLLDPERHAGYTLEVTERPDPESGETYLSANLYNPTHLPKIGYVEGLVSDLGGGPQLDVLDSKLDPSHRGKGLGVAAYEALYTHAYHRNGARFVSGGSHSTSAGHVHRALAARHGMEYVPHETNRFPYEAPGDYDAQNGNYEYTIKSESLSKKVDHYDLRDIADESDFKEGAANVDHTPHLTGHPAQHQPHLDEYMSKVVNHPSLAFPFDDVNDGVSKKVIYNTANVAPASPSSGRYMVKSYHEAVRNPLIKTFQPHQTMGWAEMANQALYHAGGIGDLHQKVFTVEHDHGPQHGKKPSLVIRMDDGLQTVTDVTDNLKKPAENDVRKIVLMDFLTGNMDRHANNLLVSNDRSKVLAIDHGRSFQYYNSLPNRWEFMRPSSANEFESLQDYMAYPHASAYLIPQGKGYEDTFEWWKNAGPKIREEMDRQAEAIKKPELRNHILNNFKVRADLLDHLASGGMQTPGWQRTPAKIHPYQGEVPAQSEEGRFAKLFNQALGENS